MYAPQGKPASRVVTKNGARARCDDGDACPHDDNQHTPSTSLLPQQMAWTLVQW